MLPDSEPYGEQRPQVLYLPPDRVSSAGAEAVELAGVGGVLYEPWQEFALDCCLSERADGMWSAYEVGLLVARQNGKGEILIGRELYGMYVTRDSLIIHTAHQFSTANEAFLRIRDIIDGSDYLRGKVASVHQAHSEEGIELLPDATIISGSSASHIRRSRRPRLRFLARKGGAARGFSCDTLVWDEAYELAEATVNAQLPVGSAMPNPQIIYASSAVDQTKHTQGVSLARVRQRALAGDDPSLVWMEWQGDEARYWDLVHKRNRRLLKAFVQEPEQWRAANPALGYGRIRAEQTAKEARAMTVRTFAVERLNIGDWPVVEDDETVIDMTRWADIADPTSRPVGPIALAVDVSPDRKWATIASAGRRSDGKLHVKVVDHRQYETQWVVDRIMDLVGAYKVCAVVLDPSGPVGSIITALKDRKLKDKVVKPLPSGHLVRVTAREAAQACGALYDDVQPKNDALRHCGQENLDDALRDASTRPLADAWAWSRKHSGGDITPVVGITLAAHGFRAYGSRSTVVPFGGRG